MPVSGAAGESKGAITQLAVFDERTGQATVVFPDVVSCEGVDAISRRSLLASLGAVEEIQEGDGLTFPCRLEIWPERKEATIDGIELPKPLTVNEFSVLHAIARAPRSVYVSRREIVECVWGKDWLIDHHAVDVHISAALGKMDARNPFHGRTGGVNQGLVNRKRSVGWALGPRAYDLTPLAIPKQ